MFNLLKIGGASMFGGAVLMFGRMAPIFANLPEELESFPPVGPEQLVILARGVGPIWQLAHGLGALALIMLAFGFYAHWQTARDRNFGLVANIMIGAAATGLGLFSVAMVIDGWGVTGAIAAWDAGIGSLGAIEQTHAQAVFLYTWGNFLIFIGVATLGSLIIHRAFHVRLWGFIGLALGVLADTGYLFGLMGDHWNDRLGMMVMLFGMIWMAVTGLMAVFSRTTRKDGTSTQTEVSPAT
jgi:hypothetical protein